MSKFLLSAFADEIDTNLKTQMDVLEKHGIKYIEMRGVNGKNVTELTIHEAEEIKRQLDARGFKISAIGSPIGKIGIKEEFEPHLKLFRYTLELAKVLGTRYIRMFSFFIPRGEDPALHRDEVMSRWSQFIREAEESGMILLHENEKDIYGDTPERCLDLLKTMKCKNLKATFDPANFVQCDCSVYPEAYALLKDHVEYVHIKDAQFINHEVVPAGYGDGRVKELLKTLYATGYEGFLSLEPHLGSFTGFAQLEPNSPANKLEEGGPKQFAIAVEALKRILMDIEK